MDNFTISIIINGLLSVVMFFLKQSSDITKQRLEKAEDEINKIKDNTVKKEDFREFKEELWVRFDKMELSFNNQLKGINK